MTADIVEGADLHVFAAEEQTEARRYRGHATPDSARRFAPDRSSGAEAVEVESKISRLR